MSCAPSARCGSNTPAAPTCDVGAEPLQCAGVRRRTALCALAALTVAACAAGEAAAPPPPTVGDSGALATARTMPESTAPDTTDDPPRRTATTTTRTSRTTTTPPTATTNGDDRPDTGPIGRLAEGNRLLMIGDSILAATAERYSGEMCAQLVPMGWAVELNAETGRQIDFGLTVLGRRLSDGWDAAVVFLGNNYTGPPEQFASTLGTILRLLQPRPVVLVTVSEHEPRQAEVNYIIRSMAERNDGVRVVDWSERTAVEDELLRSDGLHPTDAGRAALVSMIATALGRAPQDGAEPGCLPTRFTDDTDF